MAKGIDPAYINPNTPDTMQKPTGPSEIERKKHIAYRIVSANAIIPNSKNPKENCQWYTIKQINTLTGEETVLSDEALYRDLTQSKTPKFQAGQQIILSSTSFKFPVYEIKESAGKSK
jgi:hypothetical protein